MQGKLPKIAIPLILAMILTGCGASNNPSTSIRVNMTDFTFLPSTITVPAGEQVTVEVTNSGAVAHSFLIMKLGYETGGLFEPEDDSHVYWAQEQVPSGESVQATFVAPSEPGEYQIICDVAGHVEAGMVAKLIVVRNP